MQIEALLNNKYALAGIGFILGYYVGMRNPSVLNNDMIILLGGLILIYISYKNKLERFSNNNILKNLQLADNIKLDAMCQNDYGEDLDNKKIDENMTYAQYKLMKLKEHDKNPTSCSELAKRKR